MCFQALSIQDVCFSESAESFHAQQDVQENSAEQDAGRNSSFGLIKTYDGKRRSH
jgi:hypothetical protein